MDQRKDGPKKRWKPNVKVLKAVIYYVRATKRFQPKAQLEQAKAQLEQAEEIEVEEVEEVEVVGES
jgi:hypothetical protein